MNILKKYYNMGIVFSKFKYNYFTCDKCNFTILLIDKKTYYYTLHGIGDYNNYTMCIICIRDFLQ